MAKKKKKGKKKNPGRLIVTNPKKKKGGSKKRASGFFGRLINDVTTDGKAALYILGGRYAANVGAEVGARYLGGQLGKRAVLGGELIAWYALKKWKFMDAGARRLLRLGLLSEVIHEAAAMQGIDVPGRVIAMLPEKKAAPGTTPAPAPSPAPAGAEGFEPARRHAYSGYGGYNSNAG